MTNRIRYLLVKGNVIALVWCAVALAFFNVPLCCGEDEKQSITIDNYSDSEVVHFPLVLFKGNVKGVENDYVVVENFSSSLSSRITRSRVAAGRFKVLVELVEGLNHLSIACGSSRIDFSLFYRRSSNSKFVRLIYFVDSSGDFDVRTPDEWLKNREKSVTTGDFVWKLRLAGRLWQTATAERLFDAGYGRRSFTLETNASGQVVVWKQIGKKTKEEYCALSEVERFRAVYNEVLTGPAFSENACYFVLTNFIGQGRRLEEKRGRVALGSDNVAILDSNAFFSWPERLDEIDEWFSDATPVSDVYSYDSAYRNVRWALTSSSLGAGLHELGHAFGLGHSDDPNDFMSRGFDRFNRIFTVVEPPSRISEGGTYGDDGVVEWTKETATKLIRSPWIDE